MDHSASDPQERQNLPQARLRETAKPQVQVWILGTIDIQLRLSTTDSTSRRPASETTTLKSPSLEVSLTLFLQLDTMVTSPCSVLCNECTEFLSCWCVSIKAQGPPDPNPCFSVHISVCLSILRALISHQVRSKVVQVLTGTGKPWRVFTTRRFLVILRLHLQQMQLRYGCAQVPTPFQVAWQLWLSLSLLFGSLRCQ